jgi:hypothetical protein
MGMIPHLPEKIHYFSHIKKIGDVTGNDEG